MNLDFGISEKTNLLEIVMCKIKFVCFVREAFQIQSLTRFILNLNSKVFKYRFK